MKTIRKIYYFIFIVLLSLRRTLFGFNLGETVKVNGDTRAILHNGWTSIKSGECIPRKYWACVIDKNTYYPEVPETELKKVWTVKNFTKTFRSCYRFYMKNWYIIWVNSGIEPWMKGCNILVMNLLKIEVKLFNLIGVKPEPCGCYSRWEQCCNDPDYCDYLCSAGMGGYKRLPLSQFVFTLWKSINICIIRLRNTLRSR